MTEFPKEQKIDMRYSFWREQLQTLRMDVIDKLQREYGDSKMLCNADNDAIRDILKALKAAEIIMFKRLRNTIDDKLDVLTSDL